MRHNKSQSGFSIVESLVAVVLIAMVGLLLAHFSANRLSQIASKEYNSCRMQATTTLDKIRALGSTKSVGSLDMENDRITRPNSPENRLGFLNYNDETLTIDDDLYEKHSSTTKVMLKSHKALIGSMSLLNSLYDQDPRYCTSSEGLQYTAATFKLTESDDFEHLRNVNSTIKIEPYNINTGTLMGCPHPQVAIPPGTLPGQPLAVWSGVTQNLPGANNVMGYLVTVYTNYEDLNGQNQSCSASARYTYPNVSVNPKTLDSLEVTVNRPIEPNACDPSVAELLVTVKTTIPNYATEQGMVMLCRDDSSFLPSPSAAVCMGGPPPPINDFSVNSNWVPCNELTVCGKSATNAPTSKVAQGYELEYHNLNLGCLPRVEARLIDLAQNIADDAAYDAKPAPLRDLCESTCGGGNTPLLGYDGYCPSHGVTPATGCGAPSSPPDGGGPGGDGQDGASDGGNADGKGPDGGDGTF